MRSSPFDGEVVAHDRDARERDGGERRQDGGHAAPVRAEQPGGEPGHRCRRDAVADVEGDQHHDGGGDAGADQHPAAGLVVPAGGQTRAGAGAPGRRQQHQGEQHPQRGEHADERERAGEPQVPPLAEIPRGQAVADDGHEVDVGGGGHGTGLVRQHLLHHPVGELLVDVGGRAQIAGDVTGCAAYGHVDRTGRHAGSSLSPATGRRRPGTGERDGRSCREQGEQHTGSETEEEALAQQLPQRLPGLLEREALGPEQPGQRPDQHPQDHRHQHGTPDPAQPRREPGGQPGRDQHDPGDQQQGVEVVGDQIRNARVLVGGVAPGGHERRGERPGLGAAAQVELPVVLAQRSLHPGAAHDQQKRDEKERTAA
ncbi:hypothetical protein [Streptomyces viridochromogenes]